jgi:NitT/TauT family transport system substrate-binding protein
MKPRSHFTITAAIVLATILAHRRMRAEASEVSEIRIAKQYGLSYLPLVVMEEQKLVEKHARKAGLGEVKVTWPVLSGGAATNDALISGAVDYAASGVTPLIMLWAKSHGEYKGVAAVSNTPMYLNTTKPAVKSLKDFSEKDRIALPAVKVSIQAVVLQMAAAQAFGDGNFAKLDPLTVTMKHPDGLAALLSPRSEITGHLTTPPFMYEELADKRVHTVLDSYDVLGGPHTQIVLLSSTAFWKKNPRAFVAVRAALEEASAFIAKNRKGAAELYLRSTKGKQSLDEILGEINRPGIGYATEPLRIASFGDFMVRTGSIKEKPASWKDIFFPGPEAR